MEHGKITEFVKENTSEHDLKIISFLKENFDRNIDIQTLWIIKQLLKGNKSSKKKAKNTLKTLFYNFQMQETIHIKMEETIIQNKEKVIHKQLKRETEEINKKDAFHEKDTSITCEKSHPKDLNKKRKTRTKENKDTSIKKRVITEDAMEIDNKSDKSTLKNSVESMDIDNENNNTMTPKEITQKLSIPIDIQGKEDTPMEVDDVTVSPSSILPNDSSCIEINDVIISPPTSLKHETVIEDLHQEPVIGQLVNIDNQITQIANGVTDIKLYDNENQEIERENKFLKDISSLHSFYTKSQLTEKRDDEEQEEAQVVANILDLDNAIESNNKPILNDKIRKIGRRRFSTYANQLKVLKEKSSKEILPGESSSLDTSMHAKKITSIQYTFDATLPLNRINKGTDDEEKRAYLEFEFFDKKGFVKTEIIKENNNKFVIIKFDSYINLKSACQFYNRTHLECKVELKKYYRLGQ